MASGEATKRNSVEFHIESDDYFGTLATVLDLLRQDGRKNGYTEHHNELLEALTHELMYLQASYRIIRKGKEEGKP